MKKFYVLCLFLFLNACGFHLRTVNQLPSHFKNIAIEPDAPWSAFQRQLRQQLQIAGAHFDKKPDATIFIKNENQTQTNLAYGANGQVNRVRRELSIDFEVHDASGKVVSGLQHITIGRDYGINPNAQLASDDEKNLILSEMNKEAALQLVRRLMSIDRAP